MDDLDAMLDDAADECLPTVFDLDTQLKSQNKLNGVKPWLAFSSNVPQQKRDEWSRMVKVDALLQATVRASYAVHTGSFLRCCALPTSTRIGGRVTAENEPHVPLSSLVPHVWPKRPSKQNS